MAKPKFLPGHKANCGKCGIEITLFPGKNGANTWVHTGASRAPLRHPIKFIDYDPDEIKKFTKKDSDDFIANLIHLAEIRHITGRGEDNKKEVEVPPAEDPHSPTDVSARTTANCKICHKGITAVPHPETGTVVWKHNSGPVHSAVIIPSKTTIRAPKLTDEEKELVKQKKIGPATGDPVSGEITIPARAPKHKWNPLTGQVEEVVPGREEETIQGDADYIDAEGKLTSKKEAEFSKASRADQGIILKGEKHLETDHPWIAEDDLDPNNQNINNIIHPVTGKIIRSALAAAPRGNIFETEPGEIPVRETPWKTTGERATVDVQTNKRLIDYIDRARWHKETFDPNDQFEYQVKAERPEIGAPSIIVRRRLKYCQKCAPVVLQDGSIPHANTDPSLPRIANPGQSFVRPEPKELPQGSKPWARTLPNGRITITRHPNATSTPVIRAMEARVREITQTGNPKQDGFNLGSTEGK